MGLEQEIEFKQKELDKLWERVQDNPGVKKLRELWNFILKVLLSGEGLHYDQYFWILTQLTYYQNRYGHLLGPEVGISLEELDPVIRKRLEDRGWFTAFQEMMENPEG